MKNSRLTKILKSFSREELKEFGKFISSPYFARGRNLVPFFNVVRKFYPDFNENKFTNENVYEKLFPGKEFTKSSNAILKTLTFELVKMCQEFLIQSGFRKDCKFRDYYLLNKLREKKLYKEFEKKYEEVESFQEKNFGGDIHDYIDRFLLLETLNEYTVETRDYKKAFDAIAAMDETMAAAGLMRAYRGIEFKYLSASYNLNSVPNISNDMVENLDSKKLLEILKSKEHRYYPYIAINYYFYLISEYPEFHEYYFDFKKLVFENLDRLGRVEKYVLMCRMISYCGRQKTDFSDNVFINEEFEIYNKMLELGSYKWSEKDSMQIHYFRNVVDTALSLKKFEWLEDFIKEYSSELTEDIRENMKYLSLAFLNYARKDYDKALDNIHKIKSSFDHYKIEIKHLTFRIYYEMGMIEEAYSMLETIRQFIRRTSDLTEIQKKKSRFFIKYGKELLNLKVNGKKNNVAYLIREMKKEDMVNSSTWLLEKIGEMK